MRWILKSSKLKKLRDLKEESAIRLNLEVQGYAQRYIAFKKQNYDFIRTSEIGKTKKERGIRYSQN